MKAVELNKKQIRMFENHIGHEKTLLEKYTNEQVLTYIDDLTLEEVVQCILGNYYLKKKPKEKIIDCYKKICSLDNNASIYVIEILNILNIKVKGINS